MEGTGDHEKRDAAPSSRSGRRSVFMLATAISVLLIATVPGQAGASEPGEVAFSTLEMTPIGGKLYREARVPVDWRVEAQISAPFPEVPKVRPIKTITAAFPREMTFSPRSGLSVCPDGILGPGSSKLGITAAGMIAECPRALIGNGRGRLYAAGINTAGGTNLNGTELVIFYGGLTADGSPRLKVYGYDREVNAGVYMEGTWIDNVLEVTIPKLPFGTSTGYFELAIPGRNNGFPERVGKDAGFVRANCPNGFWSGTASFLLGDRLDTGEPFGEEALVRAPDFRSDCTGLEGAPSLKLAQSGRTKVSGGRASLSVVVTNAGTATARNVKVRIGGKGIRRSSPIPAITSLAPGAARRVSASITLARKGPAQARVTASGPGVRPVTLVRQVRKR